MKALIHGRYPYWFPLAALGLAMFVTGVLPAPVAEPGLLVPLYEPSSERTAVAVAVGPAAPPFHWSYALGVAFLLTVLFFVLRARGFGKPVRARTTVAVTAGGVLGIAVAAAFAEMAGSGRGAAMVANLCGPLALVGLCALVVGYFGSGRRWLTMLGVVLAAVGGYGALVAARPQLGPAGLICLGLLVLAVLERSLVLAGFAVAFLLFATILPEDTGVVDPAAIVLVVAGLVALVAGRRPPEPVTGGD
ncbi:hypothetical protein [Amycolatopsis sp. CA-230715]|uniref:hypothetical protein n=1 Tax=Amycolatopsis sp. CA-230715 TaxID=2745196 RepID=UPI001C010E0B|nr:hypothetical protein [Amycolatopsis sp. CA-230715]QWF76988.1 hypothetical protein HUW46_00368 [Amycolatopsis sp. CA-230715]